MRNYVDVRAVMLMHTLGEWVYPTAEDRAKFDDLLFGDHHQQETHEYATVNMIDAELVHMELGT